MKFAQGVFQLLSIQARRSTRVRGLKETLHATGAGDVDPTLDRAYIDVKPVRHFAATAALGDQKGACQSTHQPSHRGVGGRLHHQQQFGR